MKTRRRQLPFLVLAPAVVVVVGIAAALAIGVLGTVHLRSQSDNAATLRSRVLAATLAERLRAIPDEERALVLERAARRSGAELLLVDGDGLVRVDSSQHQPPREQLLQLLAQGEGETTTSLGRTRF